MLKTLLNEKNMSLYKLEKVSNVSHATLNDLYNERTNVEKCSVSLLHDIAKALHMSMDELYSKLSYSDLSLLMINAFFDLFRGNVCHELVELGDVEFLKKHLKEDSVRYYFDEEMLFESLYLLSMIDYLCKKNNLPIPNEYDDIRQFKLEKLYVPQSVYLLLKTKSIKMSSLYSEAIDTFLLHNILEADIYETA